MPSLYFVDCNILQFARIIRKSPDTVRYLHSIGVIHSPIRIFDALRDYFRYLPPWERTSQLHQIVAGLKLPPLPKINVGKLTNCFTISRNIQQVSLIRSVLKILNRITDADLTVEIKSATEHLQQLQDLLCVERAFLYHKIRRSHLPANVESVLLERYCNCCLWWEVADNLSYSLSHVKRLGLFLLAQG